MALIPTFQTFIRWWGEGLYNGLPDALRKLFRTALPRLVLHTHDGQRVDVQWLQDGKIQPRGQFVLPGGNTQHGDLLPAAANSKPYEVELCLGKSQVLALQHHFPEAVKENLQQVLSYQLDRLTPFTADSALFDARVAQHDRGRKEILADIFVVPKHVVERFNRLLTDIGVEPVRVVSVEGADKAINLAARENSKNAQGWSRIPLYVFLGMLVCALTVPLGYKYRRVAQLETALAEVRSNSAEQLAIREKLVAAEDALTFIASKRKTSPIALDVVETLSTLIPEHTWLERLDIQGSKLEIRGESAMALNLIDTLEDAPAFTAVRFKSPVTRNKDNGRDRFHIEATLEVIHAE